MFQNKFFTIIQRLKDYKKILIEEFIPGREIQAAIIGKKKLGAIELKPKENFMITKLNTTLKQKQNILFQLNYLKKIMIK